MTPPQISPFERAQALYKDREHRWEHEHSGEAWPHPTFEQDLFEHMKTGFVMSNQVFFVMARGINLQIPFSFVMTPAWLVQYAVGPLLALLGAMPVRLPYIAFARHNEDRMRIYSTERLLSKANQLYRVTHSPQKPKIKTQLSERIILDS